jgi:acetone carboxylase gamma subunit
VSLFERRLAAASDKASNPSRRPTTLNLTLSARRRHRIPLCECGAVFVCLLRNWQLVCDVENTPAAGRRRDEEEDRKLNTARLARSPHSP